MTVRFLGSLRALTEKSSVAYSFKKPMSVGELVTKIVMEQPNLKSALIDPELGDPRPNALILVNRKEISVLKGLSTKLKIGDEVIFVPVVHGG